MSSAKPVDPSNPSDSSNLSSRLPQATTIQSDEGEPTDAGIIRCICNFSDDDGFTIQCEKCLVWQHAFCVNVQKHAIPDEYLCDKCDAKPRNFDIRKAIEHQKRRRESERRGLLRERGEELVGVATATTTTTTATTTSTSNSSKKRPSASVSTSTNTHQGNNSKRRQSVSQVSGNRNTSPPDQVSSIKKSRNGVGSNHRVSGPAGSKASLHKALKAASASNNDDAQFMDTDSDNDDSRMYASVVNVGSTHHSEYAVVEKNIVTSKEVETVFLATLEEWSHLRSRKRSLSLSSGGPSNGVVVKLEDGKHADDLAAYTLSTDSMTMPTKATTLLDLGNIVSMERESMAHPILKTSVRKVPSANGSNHALRQTRSSAGFGLFADVDVSLGRFLIEFKGEVMLKSVYKADPANKYTLLGTAKPFVAFHPVLDLCVDARRCGNDARFIRRSCRPNAEMRSMVVPGAGPESVVYLGIFAKKQIGRGKEITVGWDWERGHVGWEVAKRAGGEVKVEDVEEHVVVDEEEEKEKRKKMALVASAVLAWGDCACGKREECVLCLMEREGRKERAKEKEKERATSEVNNAVTAKRVKKKSSDSAARDKKDARRRSGSISAVAAGNQDADDQLRHGSEKNRQRRKVDGGLPPRMKRPSHESEHVASAASENSEDEIVDDVDPDTVTSPQSKKSRDDDAKSGSPPLSSREERKLKDVVARFQKLERHEEKLNTNPNNPVLSNNAPANTRSVKSARPSKRLTDPVTGSKGKVVVGVLTLASLGLGNSLTRARKKSTDSSEFVNVTSPSPTSIAPPLPLPLPLRAKGSSRRPKKASRDKTEDEEEEELSNGESVDIDGDVSIGNEKSALDLANGESRKRENGKPSSRKKKRKAGLYKGNGSSSGSESCLSGSSLSSAPPSDLDNSSGMDLSTGSRRKRKRKARSRTGTPTVNMTNMLRPPSSRRAGAGGRSVLSTSSISSPGSLSLVGTSSDDDRGGLTSMKVDGTNGADSALAKSVEKGGDGDVGGGNDDSAHANVHGSTDGNMPPRALHLPCKKIWMNNYLKQKEAAAAAALAESNRRREAEIQRLKVEEARLVQQQEEARIKREHDAAQTNTSVVESEEIIDVVGLPSKPSAQPGLTAVSPPRMKVPELLPTIPLKRAVTDDGEIELEAIDDVIDQEVDAEAIQPTKKSRMENEKEVETMTKSSEVELAPSPATTSDEAASQKTDRLDLAQEHRPVKLEVVDREMSQSPDITLAISARQDTQSTSAKKPQRLTLKDYHRKKASSHSNTSPINAAFPTSVLLLSTSTDEPSSEIQQQSVPTTGLPTPPSTARKDALSMHMDKEEEIHDKSNVAVEEEEGPVRSPVIQAQTDDIVMESVISSDSFPAKELVDTALEMDIKQESIADNHHHNVPEDGALKLDKASVIADRSNAHEVTSPDHGAEDTTQGSSTGYTKVKLSLKEYRSQKAIAKQSIDGSNTTVSTKMDEDHDHPSIQEDSEIGTVKEEISTETKDGQSLSDRSLSAAGPVKKKLSLADYQRKKSLEDPPTTVSTAHVANFSLYSVIKEEPPKPVPEEAKQVSFLATISGYTPSKLPPISTSSSGSGSSIYGSEYFSSLRLSNLGASTAPSPTTQLAIAPHPSRKSPPPPLVTPLTFAKSSSFSPKNPPNTPSLSPVDDMRPKVMPTTPFHRDYGPPPTEPLANRVGNGYVNGSGHMSPPRGPRGYGTPFSFRGNRGRGGFSTMVPYDRRGHFGPGGGGYFNAPSAVSTPGVPTGGPLISPPLGPGSRFNAMSPRSSVPTPDSTPYDPANPDGSSQSPPTAPAADRVTPTDGGASSLGGNIPKGPRGELYRPETRERDRDYRLSAWSYPNRDGRDYYSRDFPPPTIPFERRVSLGSQSIPPVPSGSSALLSPPPVGGPSSTGGNVMNSLDYYRERHGGTNGLNSRAPPSGQYGAVRRPNANGAMGGSTENSAGDEMSGRDMESIPTGPAASMSSSSSSMSMEVKSGAGSGGHRVITDEYRRRW